MSPYLLDYQHPGTIIILLDSIILLNGDKIKVRKEKNGTYARDDLFSGVTTF